MNEWLTTVMAFARIKGHWCKAGDAFSRERLCATGQDALDPPLTTRHSWIRFAFSAFAQSIAPSKPTSLMLLKFISVKRGSFSLHLRPGWGEQFR